MRCHMKLSSKIIRLPMIAVLAMATPLAFAQSKAHDQNHATTTTMQKSTHNDNSASAMVSDAAITASVKTKLMADGRTDAMDINVDTVNGQVILRGTAANNEEKMAATELAKSVDNVKSVSNQLTMSSDPKTNPQTLSAKTAAAVSSSTATTTEREEKRHDNMKHDADKSSTAAGAQMDYPDSWITTKVKSEFATTKGISATDISVTTESGKVWLSGTVKTAAEKQQAITAAKAVKGVQSVDGSKLTVQQ